MAADKDTAQLDPAILAELKALAEREGRNVQALVNEAVAAFLRERQGRLRPELEAALEESHRRYASVYEKLAR